MAEDDDDLSALLDDYLEPPPPAPNPDYADVDIEIDPRILDKLWRKHGITEHDVRDAILGQPPAVEEEAHEDPEKRVFRGFTRYVITSSSSESGWNRRSLADDASE